MIGKIVATALVAAGAAFAPVRAESFRPPAIPLVTHDPYFSTWMMADRLTDDWSRHWTGQIQAMGVMVRVAGQTFRLMGPQAVGAPAMEQKSVSVLPTQTICEYEGRGVRVTLTFASPLLPDDLEVLARPVTYVTVKVKPLAQMADDVAVYLDATAEWAVNQPDQPVRWDRLSVSGLVAGAVGTVEQPVLGKKGDNLRIDWGRFVLAGPEGAMLRLGDVEKSRADFVTLGRLAAADEPATPRPAKDRWPGLALVWKPGRVEAAGAELRAMVAYDDDWAIQYFGRNLRAWWKRGGMTTEDLLTVAARDREKVLARCSAWDDRIVADALKAGGARYADLCALAFRQAIAAHKLVAGPDGELFFLSKENFSNGCIGTVDVTYPSAPLFLCYQPALLRGMLDPIFAYVKSGRWLRPVAPHDLGTYPLANGQVYPEDMPVEECGNMIILAAALCRVDGKADIAKANWETLTKWAGYLEEHGFDPGNQLCTDDFAGHLARNANLSLKAIVALGGYAQMAAALGETATAARVRSAAGAMAAKWPQEAASGQHYGLAFGQTNTWSLKYNLVWDRVLGLDLFDPQIAEKEVAFYLRKQLDYGIALDNRKAWAKPDWTIWAATMATKQEDFQALVAPVWKFASESPQRMPLSDWYWVDSGNVKGFRARSVVGGFWMKVLADRMAGTH